MYSLAASFSRVADAEWMRGCESVRRFSPTIGQLGQWRAFCEGGWAGVAPSDLPDVNGGDKSDTSSQAPAPNDQESTTASDGLRDLAALTPMEKPAPEYTSRNASEQESKSRAVTPSGQSPVPPPQYFPPATPADRPVPAETPRPLPEPTKSVEEPNLAPSRDERSATLASLAAFPAPPTHFPIPRLGGSRSNSSAAPPPQNIVAERVPEPQDANLPTPFPRMTDSPSSYSASQSSHPHSPVTRRASLDADKQSASTITEQIATPSPSVPSSYKRGDYMDDAEFGVRRSSDSSRTRTMEPSLGKIVERNDTGKSNGSVAALRDRYARVGLSLASIIPVS